MRISIKPEEFVKQAGGLAQFSPGQSEAAPWVNKHHTPLRLERATQIILFHLLSISSIPIIFANKIYCIQTHSKNMAQSLSKLFVHVIFHIHSTSCPIKDDIHKNLYAYIGSILKDNQSLPILINGVEDHIHILCVMSKNIALSKLVEEVKRHSSRWIKTQGTNYQKFAWQGGYGGFSVSPSLHDKTVNYIHNQKEHHKVMSFQDEYRLFLKEYGIEYDEDYVWTD